MCLERSHTIPGVDSACECRSARGTHLGRSHLHTHCAPVRYSRGPHNPGFQTVILPGSPGCALYPSAQVPQTGDSGGCGRNINVSTASFMRIVPCRAAGHARIVVKHHRCSNVKSASTNVRVPPPIASASLTHTHTRSLSLRRVRDWRPRVRSPTLCVLSRLQSTNWKQQGLGPYASHGRCIGSHIGEDGSALCCSPVKHLQI